ncbi:MAG: glycosyltransferase [Sedimentisphaerales bacterium]|nr:glycosyltransferase [Sedimentisphaerales bacterium]
MKISIITVCYNCADTLEDTVESVGCQSHSDVEHIVVDGGSSDGTQDLVAEHDGRISKFVSEPDEGIYDAMNKGIRLAEGEFVAFLNADDMYADDRVISDVVAAAEAGDVDAVYGDLLYVRRDDTSKVVRYWKAGEYLPGAFRFGWVPPHPTFFCRRSVFERFGAFDSAYRLAGDFELMLRFLEKHRVRVGYIPRPLVRMRVGGRANTVRGVLRGNREILRAFAANGLKPAPRFFWRKPLVKVGQLLKRPKAERPVSPA